MLMCKKKRQDYLRNFIKLEYSKNKMKTKEEIYIFNKLFKKLEIKKNRLNFL